MFPNVTKIIKPLSSPKYGRKLLHNLIKETLGDRQLQQIFSNIVIPTFDIKLIFLTIFSNYQDQLNHFKILFLTLFLLELNECRTLIITYSSFNFMAQVKCKPSNTYKQESVSSKSQYSYIKLQKWSRISVCSIP